MKIKSLSTISALCAAVAFSATTQAAIYDVDIAIGGNLSGGTLTGTVTGSATGTYNSATGDILFSGSYDTVVPGTTDILIGATGAINGLTGSLTNTSCTLNSGLDLCSGLPALGVPAVPLNAPQALQLTTNNVDAIGDGTLTSVLALSSGSLSANADITFTLSNSTPVSSVPVPAAAWLFGSALLGLTGIRRKYR